MAPTKHVREGMSIRLLKRVPKSSQRVLEQLVAGLDLSDSKKFDNGGPFFVAPHVEARQFLASASSVRLTP